MIIGFIGVGKMATAIQGLPWLVRAKLQRN